MSGSAVRRLVDLVATTPLAVLPPRYRFGAMLALGRMLSPLIGGFVASRFPGFVTAGKLDETMRVFVKAVQRRELEFDVRAALETPEHYDPAGAVFVTAHFPLNGVFTRLLLDEGMLPALVREHPGTLTVLGTRVPFDVVRSSPTTLLQIRSRIAQRRPVVMAIVPARPQWHPVEIETRFGRTTVATPIFTLAARLGFPLYFFGTRMSEGHPVVTIERIEPTVESFAAALERQTAKMHP